MSCFTDEAFSSAGVADQAFASAGLDDPEWDTCWGSRMTYRIIDTFGGERDLFAAAPAIADAYPSGATDDKLLPGSNRLRLDPTRLPGENYKLEANARVSSAAGGKRVKIALVDLTNDPDTPIVELTFTGGEVTGERQRSSSFAIPADADYGLKITIDDTVVLPCGWGARLIQVV